MAHRAYNLMTAALVATAALSRGEAVKISSGEIVVCDAGASSVGDRADGFVTQDAALGKPVSVAMFGGGGVGIAAGAISAGDRLKTNADGHLVATTTADDIIVAHADEDAVDNDVFAITPTPSYKY